MYLGQLLIAGVLTGAVYALLAVGLTVVYKTSNVLNFAHGYVAALAAYVSLHLAQDRDLGWPLAIVCALVVSALAGLVMEVAVIHPMRGARPLTLAVATLAAALVCVGLISLVYGTSPTTYPPLVGGQALRVSGLSVSWQDILVFLTTMAVLGSLAYMFKSSTLGLQMRTVAESARVAALLGVNARKVSVVSWCLGGFLAGVAGVLVAPRVSLTPDAITTLMIQGFVAVVMAGFTSIIGAVVGGLVSGITLNLVAGYIASDIPNITLLVLLLVVLLIRPNGLFGKSEEVRL